MPDLTLSIQVDTDQVEKQISESIGSRKERCRCGHIRGDHQIVLPGRTEPACTRTDLDQRRGCYVGCLCGEFAPPAPSPGADHEGGREG